MFISTMSKVRQNFIGSKVDTILNIGCSICDFIFVINGIQKLVASFDDNFIDTKSVC